MNRQLIREDKINIDDIESYGKIIACLLKNKDVIIMIGSLGYGKTTLTRNIAKSLESEDIITSPTFTIINEYNIMLENEESVLRHVDLYRLESEDDIDSIGLYDIIYSDGVSIIEWGDKFIDFFEKPYYILEIERLDENNRNFKLFIEK